ncbi:Cytochrome P450 704C1 [Apostasia shenzhenica]|uniref:Cytochrome P450 704C1 n=1 Tax=Apostasia shenzhenica TaxID=1088818 RepID=A0A2I0A9V4_9ASPA|nr:Cytochrome P450 704C1 [Apostasia shenzhenica]
MLPGWCFGYHTNLARKNKTFRLIKPSHSEIYTNDPANVEHFMKSNFSNYTRDEFNRNVMKDLFGDGIFSVDGEKWRHQKKLASYEFSTKVLRDFSSIVFRAKLRIWQNDKMIAQVNCIDYIVSVSLAFFLILLHGGDGSAGVVAASAAFSDRVVAVWRNRSYPMLGISVLQLWDSGLRAAASAEVEHAVS